MTTYIHQPTGQNVVIVGRYGDTDLVYVSTDLRTVPHRQDRKNCFDANQSDLVTEPSEFELAIHDRLHMGLPPVGPLTAEQTESVAAYERYCEESEVEYEAQQAAGGRTICEACGERAVTHRTVCTYGYAGHPGADYSDLGTCEKCGHHEL
jgi:hypothetical protein